jgi:hypothetical protein
MQSNQLKEVFLKKSGEWCLGGTRDCGLQVRHIERRDLP